MASSTTAIIDSRRGASGLAAQAGAVALDLDDGVEHRPDRQALVGDLAHDAVDQERRVVLDDLQPVELGVQGGGDADLRGAAAAALGETPEVGEVAGQVGRRQFRQFVRLGVGDGLLGEGLHARLCGVVAEFGLQGLEQARSGAGGAAHDRSLRAGGEDAAGGECPAACGFAEGERRNAGCSLRPWGWEADASVSRLCRLTDNR